MVQRYQRSVCAILVAGMVFCGNPAFARTHKSQGTNDKVHDLSSIEGKTLSVSVASDGYYSIVLLGTKGTVVRSNVEADVDTQVLRSSEYPQHKVMRSEFHDDFGSGLVLTVRHTGLPGMPDLVCVMRVYKDQQWGDIEVSVRNTTGRLIAVQAIRSVHASLGAPIVNLNGSSAADRILSDSFSEDRPQMAIRDIADAPKGMHRAVGSQLIYNRESGESLFLGALTSNRLLTIFHLIVRPAGISTDIVSYDAVATGTTEIEKGESLKESPAAEQVSLSLPVSPADSLSSERLMFSVGKDYHAQLEQYGQAVRLLHNARVKTPTPIGWWSWTAYYFGLNQGTALTNAEWLSQNLKQIGYTYYQIDEGYQYARGEYTSTDVNLFPRGMAYIGDRVRHSGLTFGVWTAPFEVSERAWVFQNHKEWLLHNAAGQLIHLGHINDKDDALYVLDPTNPGSQNYLRQTYTTLVHDWGVRFIKMDFMDDTAVEGSYFRPNTTALEAQRIGLEIIRSTVGEDVVLDKDGSPMLNAVGFVDAGRISIDTGHTFGATRDAASGIAARYYMNRNYFVADPDAFTVSTQTIHDQSWHEGKRSLTLDEAEVSIALSAVSGGMFEIGDDLPTLGASPERLSLVKNNDVIDMARLGRASIPIDLMTYSPSDKQPSVFLLREDRRQSILTIFNWTDQERTYSIDFARLGLHKPENYHVTDVLGDRIYRSNSSDAIALIQPPHSVRMLKLVDNAQLANPPVFKLSSPSAAKAGEDLLFSAAELSSEAPVLTCHWNFGDGVTGDGVQVHHAYTRLGVYEVSASAMGLDATKTNESIKVVITGKVLTQFVPADKQRSKSVGEPR